MIKNINRVLLLLSIILLSSFGIYAQDPVTNKLGEYLVRIKEIDSAVYNVKTKSKKQEIITNFYVDSLVSFEANNNLIVLYEFGSYTEHKKPHFALITNNDLKNVCFVDCFNVEYGIEALLACLKTDEITPRELETFKIKVLKYYINSFPGAIKQ